MIRTIGCLFVILTSVVCRGDGPADNDATKVRPIPPPGKPLAEDQVRELTNRCNDVRQTWADTLNASKEALSKGNKFQKQRAAAQHAALAGLESEVLVFPRAVEMALELNQFYNPNEFTWAMELLDEAQQRIERAQENSNWASVVGIGDGSQQKLVVGGFRSDMDDSYQPYAMVIPAGFTRGDSRPRRLDIWFHGRGETLSEVKFLNNGRKNAGQYTPNDTIVLHPYGRYSNAFKFAGETDVLESLAYIQSRLPVDDSKISVRGFSMGGAACWQFATHHAGRFFAANPGAGFSETPEFLKSFQGEDVSGTPSHQRTLWNWYDCPPWSRNLIHCPTVAYSGEIDRQKQAADVMESSLAKHGIDMVHIIGPQTAHKIHANSKTEIESRMNSLASTASANVPTKIDFTTHSLRYSRMHWVHVQGLQTHWSPANVKANLVGTTIDVETDNVTRLRFDFEAGQWPGTFPAQPKVRVNGRNLEGPSVASDRSWRFEIVRRRDDWLPATELKSDDQLRKRPGLQGPIDDAFMSRFLFVLPSRKSGDDVFQAWVDSESQHAMDHWRKHFRGDVRSVLDSELTKEQIESNHLILFGDDKSNSVISKLADSLPIRWTEDSIVGTRKTYGRKGHALLMIYPNPLNQDRYVVLNSGFTFREYDYLNNARQTPKLPDWAIIDISDGSTMRDPGKVMSAGFFDEGWKP